MVTQLKSALAMSLRVASVISIAIASLAASWFFWVSQGLIIPGGSAMFFAWSENLTGIMPPAVAQRDVGFPLLIWLSGYSWTGSLTGITLIYAAFGFLMPLLAYWTIRPFSPWIAWLTAIGVIVSCAPWLFGKFLYPDQACVFFSALSLMWLVLYLVHGRVAYLCLFTAAALFLSITRPAMNAVFPCLMLVAIVFADHKKRGDHTHEKPKYDVHHWFSLLGCIGAFSVGFIAYYSYRDRAFDVAHLGYTPSYTGEQIFYDIYINSGEFGMVIEPTIGPATRRIQDKLTAAFGDDPMANKTVHDIAAMNTPGFVAQNFALTTPALISRIWRAPNYEYAMVINDLVDDATLYDATFEIARYHPFVMLRYFGRNLGHFIFSPGWAHTRGNMSGYVYTGLTFYPAGIDLTEIDRLPPKAVQEANEPRLYPEVMSTLSVLWHWGYWPFIWGTTFLWIAGWISIISTPFLYSRAFVGSYLSASGLMLYNALIVSAFAEPDFRYQAMVLVLRATLAGLGMVAVWPKKQVQAIP